MLAGKVAKTQGTTVPVRAGEQASLLQFRGLSRSLDEPVKADEVQRDSAKPADRGSRPSLAWDFSRIPVFSSARPDDGLPISLAAAAQGSEMVPTSLEVGGVRNPAGDPMEREASGIADRALGLGIGHPLLETGLGRARAVTGPGAEAAAQALDAAAFTIGDTIVFGAGQYRPQTGRGQQLIAHEAVHVGQQARSGRPMVQRQQAGTLPEVPMAMRSTEHSVEHLDRLTGTGDASAQPATMARDPADIERNSPDPTARLPFTRTGWESDRILLVMGQFDQIPGTDSDAHRCVQAVGMAARVPDGPDAVVAYLASLIVQGMLTGQFTPRKRTAIDVLKQTSGRIKMRIAMYGDLAWAQEAMHDLFYDDVSGTPQGDVAKQVAPSMDLTKNLQTMNTWCDTPMQVMDQANQLKAGEQLLISEWTVILNSAFDQLSAEKHINVAEGQSTVVNINGRDVRIRRIPMGQRPPHTAIDLNRDTKSGHQLLILRDATAGALRLYEPEITDSGRHFGGLAADGSNLAGYFRDVPASGIYHFIEIIGKLTPGGGSPRAAKP